MLGNPRSEDLPLKLKKSALWARLGLKTADLAREALFDQSASGGFNFKTGKLPDRPYRPDLVQPGPKRAFLENRRPEELPHKLKKVLYVPTGAKNGRPGPVGDLRPIEVQGIPL